MTHATMPKKKELDWYEFEPIQEEVFGIRRCRESEDSHVNRVGDMLRPAHGQLLDLRVKVTDVDLAQAVLISMYGEGPSLIPGFELQRITMNIDLETRNNAVVTLRDLADRLERGELTDCIQEG